ATYVLGRELYDERVAAWAVVLLSLFPPFFLKSLEFRNDNLWNALWMLALLALIRRKRPFVIGLILGAALAASIKTLLLIPALVIAAIIIRAPRRGFFEAIAGFVIVPGAIATYFAAIGTWNDFVYCTLTFNSEFAWMRSSLWIVRAIFPFAFAAVVWIALRFRATSELWRYFFAVTMAVFVVMLACLWILISPRDFLPMMPLAAIFGAAAMTRTRSLVIVSVIFIAALWYYADRFENKTDWHTTMMDQALRLTHTGEMLIDYKGETIYRRRPFYYVLENITRAQMAYGMIRDTVPEDVVRTRTYVAQADGPIWPPRARAFLSENFLDMGRLRAAGQWIRDDGTFTIAIPGEYVIVDERGEARGVLDGNEYRDARTLTAGAHRFEGAKERRAVMWAPAFRRGHSPFHLRDRDF
ncbi:MAG TPA: glycosyltransferase family 39 protein, partial [Thermoanaerobaculia bacterium]|nr:glycosyltransferase family 39 protein [Thermoanaerobaculia bacterium]